jgi:hypothetical protein
MQQVQNNQNDGNDDQNMDPTADARETWADIPAEKAKQPQNDQDNNDCPQHKKSP